ncbi:MAG: DUF2628 domain-containing protein [Parvibaculum sp.]|uniref:DUF2628 domain-containing protein n=1 Tax=Parvibaculum sp. TaxID=2024848 RepID=UPI00284FC427|nr:DUF2628 domain-containing protein [Parvibaculum sp.]MDR3498170.1 DUF2628 domain-containing protein [Parvibaculum sp.]
MRIYTVHQRAGAPADGEGLVFVKEGFAWPALFVPLLWLLFARLWLAALAFAIVALALAAAAETLGLGPNAAIVLSLALQFLLACEANDIRRWTLARRGYAEIAIASGRTLVEAERDFFRRWEGPSAPVETRSAAPHRAIWPRRPEDRGPIGVFPKAGG